MLPYMNAATFKLGFSTKLLVMEDHTGTHVDASLHFYDGARRTPRGRGISELPLEKLYGDAVCIDVSAKAASDPVTADMLAAAVDKQKVDIKKDDIVLVRFWSGTWGGDAFLAARARERRVRVAARARRKVRRRRSSEPGGAHRRGAR
jgi:kynurenine formamidase